MRIPRHVAAGLALVVLSAAGVQGTEHHWRALRAAAGDALARHDTAQYLSAMRALQLEVGTTPRIANGLASASLILHDTAASAHWLDMLASMGMDFDTADVAPTSSATRLERIHALGARRDAANAPAGRSELLATFSDADLLPEDLAYDASRKRFLVASAHRGTIEAVDAAGRVTTFATGNGWGFFAIAIDNVRNTVWTTAAAFAGAPHYVAADSGKSAVLEFDLTTGLLRRQFALHDNVPHLFGDFTLAPTGALYMSDGISGGIYALDPGATGLRQIAEPGSFSSPQTPVLSADGKHLYVPDYSFGIADLTLPTGEWRWLPHPDSIALTGIDGMQRDGNDLIVLQNGLAPNRIMRLRIADGRIATITPIIRGGEAEDLNHFVIRGHDVVFIARSGWDRAKPDGSMTAAGAGQQPTLRRAALVAPK